MIFRTPPNQKRKLNSSPISDRRLVVYNDHLPVSTFEPSDELVCTYQCRQLVKSEFVVALDSAEKQAVEYKSKVEGLSNELERSEEERNSFEENLKYTKQELEATKGREHSLQERLLKEITDSQERYQTQLKKCYELEAQVKKEAESRKNAELAASEAKERATFLEGEIQKLSESTKREKISLQMELKHLKDDSNLSISRVTADLEKTKLRACNFQKETELLKDQLKVLQDQLNEKYYELDPLSKDLIIKKMSEAFRRHKNDLCKKHYDHFIIDEERMRNCSSKIAQDDWEEFIRNESKPEVKEKRNRGKKSRSMLEYGHHSGRKSHAMITQEMVDSSPGTEVSRLQVWEKTHTKKDDSMSDATSSFFDKIEKEKETTSGGDEAVFITVFGKDVKGRSRSIGTNIVPTQIKGATIPCKRLKEAQGEYEQRLQNVEQKLTKLDNMDDKLERLLSIVQDNRQVGSEIGTSQFATPTNQLIDQRCEILNFEDEVIATGTICRDSTALLIHGKLVPPTYEKVVLDKILLPDELTAKLCRQFTETFRDVGVGGYVSHLKGLIRYL